ncbi:MAG TPA: glycosyltransferase family 4 protein [Bacteroidia bacterium]|jgi:glycosyltransferase involved in cell wall biosynthesis|nr:glycosyltransferase family 4 protein [Bacteroidia bacterium]
MPKPVILLFIDWFLPGYKAGGPISSCAHLIEQLRDEFDFRIVTRDTDYTESIPYPGIASNTWIQREEGVWVYYFSDKELNWKNMARLMANTPCHKIYLNGIYSRYFTGYPLLLLRNRKESVVIAARGMLAPSAIAVKKTKKMLFLRVVTLLGLFRKVTFHATNLGEVKDIHKQFGTGCKVMLAGNLSSLKRPVLSPRVKQKGALTLISVARIAPEKNLLYALEILSRIHQGHIRFLIYGPVYDAKYEEQCKEQSLLLPSNIQVEFKGSVDPEKVHDLLSQAHALWMPTRGENFGHIIVQAWGAGCPVIISDQTPWHQLDKQGLGMELPLQEPELFARAIGVFVNMEQEEYNRLSECCYHFALNRARDEGIVEENRRLFR